MFKIKFRKINRRPKYKTVAGPDFEEGPHSQIGDDEFYDAVENALDKLEEEQQARDLLKMVSVDARSDEIESATKTHERWAEIDSVSFFSCFFSSLFLVAEIVRRGRRRGICLLFKRLVQSMQKLTMFVFVCRLAC